MSTNARPDLRQRLADGTMIIAEGYVFELERRGYIKAGPYVPEVVLDYPDAVKELHREFLLAGSDVMVALTYYAHRDKLKDVGRENDLEEMNRTAVRLAQEVAAEGNALVAGNICNTWMYDPSDPVNSGSHVRDMYTEQVGWAKDAGVDFVLSETNDFLGEAEIALEVCQEAGLDAVINFASVTTKTRDGFSYVDACKRLADKGAAVVGMNCSRGPGTLLPVMRELRQELSIPLAAVPVPYRTTDNIPTMQMLEFEGARAFPMSIEPHVVTRFEFADFAAQAHDIGIEMIGVCCGGAPYHVRAAAEAIGRKVPASRYSPALDLHPDLSTERAKA